MPTLTAYTPTAFFKQMTSAPKTFQDLVPQIEAHAALHRAATTSRGRALHLANLYSYVSDHMTLLWADPKQLADFTRKARELLLTIPDRPAPEYEACRDALQMFIVLAGPAA